MLDNFHIDEKEQTTNVALQEDVVNIMDERSNEEILK